MMKRKSFFSLLALWCLIEAPLLAFYKYWANSINPIWSLLIMMVVVLPAYWLIIYFGGYRKYIINLTINQVKQLLFIAVLECLDILLFLGMLPYLRGAEAQVIMASTPIIYILICSIWMKYSPTKGEVSGIILCFFGAIFIGIENTIVDLSIFTLIATIGMCFRAIRMLATRKITLPPIILGFSLMLFNIPIFWGIIKLMEIPLELNLFQFGGHVIHGHIAMLFSALIYLYLLKHSSPARMSIAIVAIMPLSLVFVSIIHNEALSVMFIFGFGVIMVGTLLVEFFKK